MVVIQMEPYFERSLGKPLLTLEQLSYVGQEFVKRHAQPSRARGASMRRSLSLVCCRVKHKRGQVRGVYSLLFRP